MPKLRINLRQGGFRSSFPANLSIFYDDCSVNSAAGIEFSTQPNESSVKQPLQIIDDFIRHGLVKSASATKSHQIEL